jgi:hypothetical protein
MGAEFKDAIISEIFINLGHDLLKRSGEFHTSMVPQEKN